MIDNKQTLADVAASIQTLRCPFNNFVQCLEATCAMWDPDVKACMRDRYIYPFKYCTASPFVACCNVESDTEDTDKE